MSLLTAFAILPAVLLACSTPPPFPPQVSVTDVVNTARCEFYEAATESAKSYPQIKNWSALFDFTFFVEQYGSASTDTSFVIPVQAGTFGIGFKANFKETARSTYNFKVKLLKGLDEAPPYLCKGEVASKSPKRRLNGDIGLHRWLSEVVPHIAAVNASGPRSTGTHAAFSPGKINDLTYTIEFVVNMDGSVSPSWSLTYPSKRQAKPGFGFGLSEQNSHKLIVTMTGPVKLDPLDYTVVTEEIDGRDVIISRNVCVMNDGVPCPVPKPFKAAEAALEKQRERSAAAQTKRIEFDERIKDAAPGSQRSLPPIVLFRKLERDEFSVTTQQKEELRALKVEADRATEEARAAKANAERERTRALVRTRVATQKASEEETSRRLELLLQQELLRSAFRP